MAVLRPANFVSSSGSKNLDQKYIVKNNYEMVMEVNYRTGSGKAQHMHSSRITSTSCKGLHGLYIFPLGCKFPKFFHKAGLCTFRFCLVSDLSKFQLLFILFNTVSYFFCSAVM